MSIIWSRRDFIACSAAALLLMPRHAKAVTDGNYVIEMLSKDPNDPKQRNLFSPRLQVIDAGESILFQATDRGHNCASIKGMIPDGVDPWKGKIGKDIEITFDNPGFHGYVCTPHASLGMVGLVVVKGEGMLTNLDAARAVKHRGKSQKVFDEIWAEVEAQGLLLA
ncbi:MAG: pseudoazurin [Pseudomonadota bacterium]